jgi:signal transduction histidine kinase
MPSKMDSSNSPNPAVAQPRLKWDNLLAVYLFYMAILARSLAEEALRPHMPLYLALELAFLLLFTLVLWRPGLWSGVLHLYFCLQAVLTLVLISLHPEFDFVVNLFVLLSFQAALVFTDPVRWIWIGSFVFLAGGSLIFYLGMNGLAMSLLSMVGCILFAAYVVTNQEVELARIQSQTMLNELQETHLMLEQRASQVEELAAIEERNRLARELHDSVSQTMFSIVLNIRTAQILLERNPAQMRPQLEKLQGLTQSALGQMRSLIAQLRPQDPDIPIPPTPPPPLPPFPLGRGDKARKNRCGCGSHNRTYFFGISLFLLEYSVSALHLAM